MNKIAIGIDVGISTTKIVGIRDGEVVGLVGESGSGKTA